MSVSSGNHEPTTPSLSIQLRSFSAETPDGWQPVLEHAVTADRAGIDRLVVSDHIAFGENLDAYGDPKRGGTAGGKQPTGPDGHWLEPLTLLSVIAGLTSHARLATGILIAALRRPAVLAKTAATLDVLSSGRLDLGVGVGWQREEYEVSGLDYASRGRLLDHTLEVCRTLWTQPVAAMSDDNVHFERIHTMPKPLQPGGVPIWVSGTVNQRVLDRLTRFGTGWIPWGPDATDPEPGIEAIRHALADAGRNPSDLQVQGTLPVVRDAGGEIDIARTMKRVPELVDTGITDFRVSVRARDQEEMAERLAHVAAVFRHTVGRPPHES